MHSRQVLTTELGVDRSQIIGRSYWRLDGEPRTTTATTTKTRQLLLLQ
jgi:NADPH-dependent ferric siderophore reductase